MPNPGSYTFFGVLTVNWSYDSGTQELTISATFDGKSMGSTTLTPAKNTGQLNGADGNQNSHVGLTADFTVLNLQMNASATNPTRSQTHNSDF
jgi:hypothetical protein